MGVVVNNRDKRLEYDGVVRPVLLYLNSLPESKAINIHGGVFTQRGTPDILGSIRGRTICLECKRSTTESPEDIQKRRLGEWAAAGAIAACVSSVEQVKELLTENRLLDRR